MRVLLVVFHGVVALIDKLDQRGKYVGSIQKYVLFVRLSELILSTLSKVKGDLI